MIRLNLPKSPYWLDLGLGVRVQVKPLDTATMAAARASVDRSLREAGDVPADDDARAGMTEALLITALARHAIVAWEGVLAAEGDDPAPVDERTVGDLMSLWSFADRFWRLYTAPYELLAVEKNALQPAPTGTSEAGRPSAEAATTTAPPAPEAAT